MDIMYSQFFCFFEFPHVYEKEKVTFQVVGERSNIKRFVDMLSDLGFEVEIGNVRKYHVKGRALLSELTQKQYECMKMAVQSGYFEIPRRADLRKLAKKKKITHGAFSFHLRKAQRTINKALFG
jgi:predicted DNA binding protein